MLNERNQFEKVTVYFQLYANLENTKLQKRASKQISVCQWFREDKGSIHETLKIF